MHCTVLKISIQNNISHRFIKGRKKKLSPFVYFIVITLSAHNNKKAEQKIISKSVALGAPPLKPSRTNIILVNYNKQLSSTFYTKS